MNHLTDAGSIPDLGIELATGKQTSLMPVPGAGMTKNLLQGLY